MSDGKPIKHFWEMEKNWEFEKFLDKHWPLWCEPKNLSTPLYHHLKASFDAGWKSSRKRTRKMLRK